MTPVDHVPENTADDDLQPAYGEIDALLDGEAVDKALLRAMLEDPAARDYFVDALALRQLARDMEPGRFVVRRTPRGRLVRAAQWVAAAVILIVGAGAGYLYGHRADTISPPSGSLEVIVTAPAPVTPPPPAPTRSIRFEPGVNWTVQTRSH
jgi:hypothetical protein